MLFLYIVIALSIAVCAVSSVVWLFCFLGIAYSGGHQNVSKSVFTTMPKSGWVALVSFNVAILSAVVLVLSFQD